MKMKLQSFLLSLLALTSASPLFAETEATREAPTVSVDEAVLETVTVIGSAKKADEVPGSATVVTGETLKASRVMTTNEALRKAPGVNVRDEEGFGMRPNIGVRGLNPTRSTKVLLLEDGLPLAYAPYGDNASYYHPPIDRFARVEILKGSSMNLYGPQTVGAVINYLTPNPTQEFQGLFSVAAGNRGFLNARGRMGANGLLFDFVRKEGDGARDFQQSTIEDYNFKGVFDLSPNQLLILRANRFDEDSAVSYSGITDAEYANFGREYNPLRNDSFDAQRYGSSATHELSFGSDDSLTTSFYWSHFSRDWWRQASTVTDSQCNATTYSVDGQTLNFQQARRAGFAVDSRDCNSTQGRLRDYYTYGVEPRLRLTHALLGLDNELTLGLRAHRETQDRVQRNGTSPTARDGSVSERNKRETEAYAAFVQNRFGFGRLAVTPGLRYERIDYLRRNRLNGDEGEEELDALIPSLGATFTLTPAYTLFASAHRGFAPPRTEDIISGTGVSVDVDSEKSLNAEAGLRARPMKGLGLELTAFRNDFERLIAVGSIAGGNVPLSEGEALFQGFELSGRADLGLIVESAHNVFFELAYTAVPTARTEKAFTRVDTGATVAGSEEGKRLPYAPKNLFTSTLGYAHPVGFEARVEVVFVDEQFSDFANTQDPDGSGLVGVIDDYTVWNATLNYRLPGSKWTVFAATKNLGDEDYVVDRTRGIQTGQPRLVQGGVEFEF